MIAQLEQGMDCDRMSEILGPPPATGLPVFFYSADDGGHYVVFAFATNEVSAPTDRAGDCVVVAVTKRPPNWRDANDLGEYVIPRAMIGTRCTGIALPRTNGE